MDQNSPLESPLGIRVCVCLAFNLKFGLFFKKKILIKGMFDNYFKNNSEKKVFECFVTLNIFYIYYYIFNYFSIIIFFKTILQIKLKYVKTIKRCSFEILKKYFLFFHKNKTKNNFLLSNIFF